jgi:hypothetical protein
MIDVRQLQFLFHPYPDTENPSKKLITTLRHKTVIVVDEDCDIEPIFKQIHYRNTDGPL